jgi:hypothetical protein
MQIQGEIRHSMCGPRLIHGPIGQSMLREHNIVTEMSHAFNMMFYVGHSNADQWDDTHAV